MRWVYQRGGAEMTDYTELIKALRFETDYVPVEKTMRDAAAAIEDLEGFLAEAERDRDEYEERMRKEQERVLDLQARLGEAENSVENYKRMWLEKHEPKIGRWKGWTATHWTKQYDANGAPIYSEHTYYECSYCGRKTAIKENFCPNCGAVMQDMCEVQDDERSIR